MLCSRQPAFFAFYSSAKTKPFLPIPLSNVVPMLKLPVGNQDKPSLVVVGVRGADCVVFQNNSSFCVSVLTILFPNCRRYCALFSWLNEIQAKLKRLKNS